MIGYKLIFAPEVENDLQEGIDWYNEKQAGLGIRFFKEVKRQLNYIKKNPYTIAVRYDVIRCSKIKNFPYLIHFKVEENIKTIKIIAVFNTNRNPAIWVKRGIKQ